MIKILIVLGPTATGKTDLALELAKKYNGEIVACDSRQVYRGLDIGTGKLPIKTTIPVWNQGYKPGLDIRKGKGFWEINGVKIWMYDVVDLRIQYTVADYVKDADKVIREIRERGRLPIIVGGTGLYLKALLEGLPNLLIPVNKKLRWELEKLTLKELQEKLQIVSLKRWKKMNQSDRRNPRRLIRAIEMSTLSLIGRLPPLDRLRVNYPRNDTLKIGLTAPREVLYRNADLRVLSRIDLGMIDEAKKLQNQGVSLKRMRKLGLEYGVLADYLSGEITGMDGNNGFIKILQGKIHGYIRRQLTWFKKEGQVHWFDIIDKHYINNVEMLVRSWYHGGHDKKN